MNSKPNKKYLPLNLGFITFILIGLLLIYYEQISTKDQFLGIFIQIVGTFFATLWGVFLSFQYTRKLNEEKQLKQDKDNLLASLKLLYSELDVNEGRMTEIIEALTTMPREIKSLYDNFSIVINLLNSLKFECFYALISSNNMNIISRHHDLFNHIQQTYYNIDLAKNRLLMSYDAFKDVTSGNVSPEIEQRIIHLLEYDKVYMNDRKRFIIKTKKLLASYLSDNGFTFRYSSVLEDSLPINK